MTATTKDIIRRGSKFECKVCGQTATAKRYHQQFCGLSCSTVFTNKQRDNSSRRYNCNCKTCGKAFEAKVPYAMCCSNACRQSLKWIGKSSPVVSCLHCGGLTVSACNKTQCKSAKTYLKRWVAVRQKLWTCVDCKEQFRRLRGKSHLRCKGCWEIHQKQMRRKQRRAKRIKRANRERNAISDGVADEIIFERAKWRCRYCGIKTRPCDGVNFDDLKMATIDHVVPLSKGGTDTEDNKVCACFKCNCIEKGTENWLLF